MPLSGKRQLAFCTSLNSRKQKTNDFYSSFDGEPIDFILRRVEIWKEANRRRLSIYMKKAFGKLIVDFSAVPDAHRARLAPVPALHRSSKRASKKAKGTRVLSADH